MVEREVALRKHADARGGIARRAVTTDGAAGDRDVANCGNPATLGIVAGGAVAADGGIGECRGPQSKDTTAIGAHAFEVLLPSIGTVG